MSRFLVALLMIVGAVVLFGWVLGAALWLITLPFRILGDTLPFAGDVSGGQVLAVLLLLGLFFFWHRQHRERRALSFASGVDDDRWEREVRRARRHWERRHEYIANFGDKASYRLHTWSVRWRARHQRPYADDDTGGAS